MTPEEATAAVIDALDALQIPYMLAGSLSCNYYAIPRSTQDADFVVQLEAGAISSLAVALVRHSNWIDRCRSRPSRSRGVMSLRLTDGAFVVELFLLSDDAHDQERFARRRRERILDRDVAIPTVEDVVITKLRWSHAGGRRKDIEDVENVIAVQGDRIDWDYVNSWCDRHGTRELLDRLRQTGSESPRRA